MQMIIHGEGGTGKSKVLQSVSLVTENVETDLDITNGACGEIVKIVLHEDEPPIAQGAVVKLR